MVKDILALYIVQYRTLLDNTLSMTNRISSICKSYFHLRSSATPLAVVSHQSVNIIQNLVFSIHSGSSPRYTYTCTSLVTPYTKVESRSSLRSSAKGDYLTQRTSSSFGRRGFAVAGLSRVKQSTCLPPSRANYRILQNQTKNSSFQIYYYG